MLKRGGGEVATYPGTRISLHGLEKKATAICKGKEEVESAYTLCLKSLVKLLCNGDNDKDGKSV